MSVPIVSNRRLSCFIRGLLAVAMATGPASALQIIDRLSASGALAGYHLLPATRAELLSRLGRHEEARSEFAVAAGLAGNDRERALLQARAAEH